MNDPMELSQLPNVSWASFIRYKTKSAHIRLKHIIFIAKCARRLQFIHQGWHTNTCHIPEKVGQWSILPSLQLTQFSSLLELQITAQLFQTECETWMASSHSSTLLYNKWCDTAINNGNEKDRNHSLECILHVNVQNLHRSHSSESFINITVLIIFNYHIIHLKYKTSFITHKLSPQNVLNTISTIWL